MACYDANGKWIPCPDSGNDTQYGGTDNVVMLPDPSMPKMSIGGNIPAGQFSQNRPTGVSNAQAYYLNMTKDERDRLQQYYNEFGPAFGFKKPKSLWYEIVEAVANTGITPWQQLEALSAQVRTNGVPDGAAGPGGGGPSGPRPFYNETVNLTNPEDAQILVQNALSQYLGRNATDDELAAFTKALRKEEQASPQISKGISGDGVSKSTQSGGVTAQQAQDMARDFAQSRPDYAEFQASTNLLDAFIGVLENKGRIV